ncbi:unnamed protein product [Penicillium salamii]|nr:unnamed protein product [Penicillium salamii]
MASISFGQANSGFQVGVNQGPIYSQQENGIRVNIGSSSAKTTNEKIKEAIGARLGSSPRKKKPYPGTCEWLGTIQNFRHWITNEPPSRGLLWICGGPGKGKSHLSTHLVARLEIGSITTEPGSAPLKSELGNDRLVLSYFCDASDILHSTELAVVLGLLNQLLEWKESEELYSLISPKFSGRGQDFFSSSFIQDLWDCFEQMIRVISKNYQVYLVLDGLDECNSSSQAALSGQMRKICDDHQQNEHHAIKVVIFSRPLDLCHQMDLRVDLHTANSLERTKEDIRMIVEASCRLQQEDQEHFCNILTERAKGTFLWVALAISLLKDTSVQQKVVCENSAFLDQLLPIGLDAMYNRMLFNIIEHLQGKSHGQDMMRIFHCLTFSQRPLTIKEVGVLAECNDSIVQDALYAFDHILSTTEGGLGEDAIELIHVSLREYLVKRSSTLISEKISWFFWPYLSFTLGSLRENRFQLWFLDYAILATLCFHFQGFLRRHSTLGFGIFSLTLCYAFQRFRSSLLIDLIGRALGRLMTKLLMVIFCVKTGSIHLYLFERCIAVMSDEKSGLKRDIHDAESPQHLQNRLEMKERWCRVQYPSRYWVAHLEKSESKLSVMDKVDIFLKQHFLHWLEVLAHLGIVSGAVGDLSIIKRLAQVSGSF